MKFYTHYKSPRQKTNKRIFSLLIFGFMLLYIPFLAATFLILFYEKNLTTALFFALFLPVFVTFLLVHEKDLEKAYVEIHKDKIHVVDYCFGIKKESQFSLSEITSAEICVASSCKVKGYRAYGPVQYIIFKKNNTYLFKLVYLPETAEPFQQYLS